MASGMNACRAESSRYALLNTYVNALTMDETVEEIKKIVEEGVPTQHAVINALKVNLMEDDPQLVEIVNSCPIINADGASIVWAAKFFGIPLPERVTGIDLFLRLVELAEEEGYAIYLFGAQEEVVCKVKTIFEKRFPSLRIAGYRNGYFSEEDEPQIVSDIASSGADMLFVGFSSPKKEYWISQNLDKLGVPFVMGVGGSFDVVAGVTSRAPKWMQDHGLEWLHRFVQEPRRLWRRYVLGNARFVCLTLKYRLLKDGGSANG